MSQLKEADLETLPYGDERKVLIALVIKSETTVPLTWIAQRLKMGTRSTVSRETTGEDGGHGWNLDKVVRNIVPGSCPEG